MTEVHPSPDDHRDLLGHAGERVAFLVTVIHEAFGKVAQDILPLAVTRRILGLLVLPAEAALRRAIHLIADTLGPLAVTANRNTSRPQAIDRARGAARPRVPRFRLGEGQPRVTRVAAPKTALPSATRIPAEPARASDRLRARVAALKAALADPDVAPRGAACARAANGLWSCASPGPRVLIRRSCLRLA